MPPTVRAAANRNLPRLAAIGRRAALLPVVAILGLAACGVSGASPSPDTATPEVPTAFRGPWQPIHDALTTSGYSCDPTALTMSQDKPVQPSVAPAIAAYRDTFATMRCDHLIDDTRFDNFITVYVRRAAGSLAGVGISRQSGVPGGVEWAAMRPAVVDALAAVLPPEQREGVLAEADALAADGPGGAVAITPDLLLLVDVPDQVSPLVDLWDRDLYDIAYAMPGMPSPPLP